MEQIYLYLLYHADVSFTNHSYIICAISNGQCNWCIVKKPQNLLKKIGERQRYESEKHVVRARNNKEEGCENRKIKTRRTSRKRRNRKRR